MTGDGSATAERPDASGLAGRPDSTRRAGRPDTGEPTGRSGASNPAARPATSKPASRPNTSETAEKPDANEPSRQPDSSRPTGPPDTSKPANRPNTSETAERRDGSEPAGWPDRSGLAGRRGELLVLDGLLAAQQAERTASAVVVVEGRPGLGRSSLLRRAAVVARGLGTRVLTARCSRMESDFRYGVVTQLLAPFPALEPVLSALSRSADEPVPHATSQALSAALLACAAQRPLLIVVDDAQWADAHSLDLFARLVRLLGDARVTVLLSTLPAGRPKSVLGLLDLHALTGAGGGRGRRDHLLRLAPLGPEAVAEILTDRGWPAPLTPPFTASVTEACQGNPAVLSTALDTLRGATEPDPSRTSDPEALQQALAEALTRLTATTVAGLAEEPKALLRACVVATGALGPDQLGHLAGLSAPAADRALVTLQALGILTEDEHPVPVVGDASRQIIAELPPRERENLFARAAELFYGAGVRETRVVRLLLAAPSFRPPWAGEVLRRASAEQRMSGGHSTLIPGLEHALGHTDGPAEQISLHIELALAKTVPDPPAAQRHLEIAFHLSDRRPESAAQRLRATDLLTVLQGPDALTEALVTRRPAHRALSWKAQHPWNRPLHTTDDPLPDHDRAGLRAWHLAATGESLPLARTLARQALAAGTTADSPPRPTLYTPRLAALGALLMTEDIAEVVTGANILVDGAQSREDTPAAALGLLLLAGAHGSLGRTDRAITALTSLAELTSTGPGHPRVRPLLAAARSVLLRLTGDLPAAERALCVDSLPVPDENLATACFLFARAEVRTATGRPRAALADLLRCSHALTTRGWTNPALLPWRSRAADLAREVDDAAPLAARLTAEELRLARAWGAPAAIARAVRGAGGDPSAPDRPPTAGSRTRGRTDTTSRTADRSPLWDLLTPAERRVTELAALGFSNRHVAERLSIGRKTVELHLTRAYRKLGVSGRAQLTTAMAPEATGSKGNSLGAA